MGDTAFAFSITFVIVLSGDSTILLTLAFIDADSATGLLPLLFGVMGLLLIKLMLLTVLLGVLLGGALLP